MSDNANSFPGFVPCNASGQGEYKGVVNRYAHLASDGTAIYRYQFVSRVSASSDSVTGLPVVTAPAQVYSDVTGICVGMEPIASDVRTMYCAASTYRILLVAECTPDLYFRAIGDDSGGTLTAANAGKNIQWVAGTPSTITGHGNDRLKSTSVTANVQDGSSHNNIIRLVKLDETPGRQFGASDKYKVFICKINQGMCTETDTTGV